MVSLLKRQVSLRVTDVLKSLSAIGHEDQDIHLKVDYFNKINRVDKSSKYALINNKLGYMIQLKLTICRIFIFKRIRNVQY